MAMLVILAQWTLRSSVLILSGTLLLSALRVKDPSLRLAAWIAMLLGSLAIPVMTTALPAIPLAVIQTHVPPAAAPAAIDQLALGTTQVTQEGGAETITGKTAPF